MTEETQTPEAVQAPESKPLICDSCGELGFYIDRVIRPRGASILKENAPKTFFAVRCVREIKPNTPATICCETLACPTKEEAAKRWFELKR
jgi:hypothetical protein